MDKFKLYINQVIVENINLVKEQLLSHAIYFLENMGEFYPIGMAILPKNKIIFHGVEENDPKDSPSIEDLTKRLSDKLINYLEEQDALCVGMALNTGFSNKNGEINTIEMRILDEYAKEEYIYFTYQIINTKVVILNKSDTPWRDLSLSEN